MRRGLESHRVCNPKWSGAPFIVLGIEQKMTTPQAELPPLNVLLTHLEWNLKRMEEIQKEKKTDYFRDAALQRYGFTFDSALKCIRAGALLKSQTCETAEECFELAERLGWLGQNADWQALVSAHEKMNPDSLKDLEGRYGGRLVPIKLDVTDDSSIANAAKVAKDVDILVNNSGIFRMSGFFTGNTVDTLQENMDVNVFGLVKLTKSFIDVLRGKERAAIVNIASIAALGNMPMAATYSASKAAVHSITRA